MRHQKKLTPTVLEVYSPPGPYSYLLSKERKAIRIGGRPKNQKKRILDHLSTIRPQKQDPQMVKRKMEEHWEKIQRLNRLRNA
jgi:hypothetical protein